MHYLGIDFGLKRIGLAISDGIIAAPLKTLEVKNFKDSIEKIQKLIKEEGSEQIVVGLPEGRIGQTVLGFIKALRQSGLNVVEADETLSTQRATAQMIDSGISRKNRQINDATAAAIILQNYLDSIP